MSFWESVKCFSVLKEPFQGLEPRAMFENQLFLIWFGFIGIDIILVY